MKSSEPTTGIVIVTHNSSGFLETCLEAALARCQSVVVVDNASTDSTCQTARRHGRVRLLANPVNRGFAAAVNQGFGVLGCEYVLVLNPDAILSTDLSPLVEACSSPGCGAAAGLLLDEAGLPQSGFTLRRFPTPTALAFEALGINRIWPSNPVNRRYRCLDLDLRQPQPVEQPAGAFLMVRRGAWEQVGGFDESFQPVWFEDVDFLVRLSQAGFQTLFAPEAVALHYGGHSVACLPEAKRIYYWYGNLLRYAAKHFRQVPLRLVCTAVGLGAFFRMLAGMAGPGRLASSAGYGAVMRLALKGAAFGGRAIRTSAVRAAVDIEIESNRELNDTHLHGL